MREDEVEVGGDGATRTGTVIEPDFVSRSLRHQLVSANKLIDLNRSQATAYSDALDRYLEEMDGIRHRFARCLLQLRASQRDGVKFTQQLTSAQAEKAKLLQEIVDLQTALRDQDALIERLSGERDAASAGMRSALEEKARADSSHERRMARMKISAEKLFQKSARRLAWRLGGVVALSTAVATAAATVMVPWALLLNRIESGMQVLFGTP